VAPHARFGLAAFPSGSHPLSLLGFPLAPSSATPGIASRSVTQRAGGSLLASLRCVVGNMHTYCSHGHCKPGPHSLSVSALSSSSSSSSMRASLCPPPDLKACLPPCSPAFLPA
jgi:hypothetical protein